MVRGKGLPLPGRGCPIATPAMGNMDMDAARSSRGCFIRAVTGLAFACAPCGSLADAPAPAFVPIPVIITDPNSGTTVGVLPTWLLEDEQGRIHRIIAPDIQHNTVFGWGAHARLLDYPSDDVQWSAVVGAYQHVQRKIDLEYESGRLRDTRWSFSTSLLYIRDGTPRYYGVGNNTPQTAESNYTTVQRLAQAQIGLNLSRDWQLLYALRLQQIDVQPGTLQGIPSIQTLFGTDVLGTTRELLNRLAIVYDTRNDLTVPSQGMRWFAYGGIATQSVFGAQQYSEAGLDGSVYRAIRSTTVLAAHVALRYLPCAEHVVFWQLSSVGGDRSFPGGPQPLRGFGAGRFTDRNSFSFTAEIRQSVVTIGVFKTHVEVELAPYLELGKVFERASSSPVSNLHRVFGLGFRGIARPFVVAYVDVGYGEEGAAVFTGINYPF
jgi:Omp85 superfamily domain